MLCDIYGMSGDTPHLLVDQSLLQMEMREPLNPKNKEEKGEA